MADKQFFLRIYVSGALASAHDCDRRVLVLRCSRKSQNRVGLLQFGSLSLAPTRPEAISHDSVGRHLTEIIGIIRFG